MANIQAVLDFNCIDDECGENIQFNVMQLKQSHGEISCQACHKPYKFVDDEFMQKLEKLRNLVVAVKDAEDILDDCNVGITTVNGETTIPYRLLLTRLNTLITLDIGGRKIDFHLRVEPLVSDTFH